MLVVLLQPLHRQLSRSGCKSVDLPIPAAVDPGVEVDQVATLKVISDIAGLFVGHRLFDWVVHSNEIRVALLPGQRVCAVEPLEEGCAHEVWAVAEQLADIAGLPQDTRQMVFATQPPVLPRIPRPADAPGREIGSMRNCGKTARIQPRQTHAPLRKTVKVGRAHRHRSRAIEQIVVSKGVGNYDNDVHRFFPGVVVVKRPICPVLLPWPPPPGPLKPPAPPSSQTMRPAFSPRAQRQRQSCGKCARNRRRCHGCASA